MEQYLLVGTIFDTFGLDGSLKVYSSSNNKDIRYKKGNVFLAVDKDGNERELKLISIRPSHQSANIDILKFEGINNANEALLLKGYELRVKKDYKDLKEGYFFFSDLLGCDVISDGKKIGEVIKVEEFPAQVTLRAKSNEGKEFFIPFVKAFIKHVDVENKTIDINYMEGML
ncbi:MAG: ribosome maturation factor RimM [Bacilli bacterium]|nr:ribosome maturation factor RimM [Bacilli bacterium]